MTKKERARLTAIADELLSDHLDMYAEEDTPSWVKDFALAEAARWAAIFTALRMGADKFEPLDTTTAPAEISNLDLYKVVTE